MYSYVKIIYVASYIFPYIWNPGVDPGVSERESECIKKRVCRQGEAVGVCIFKTPKSYMHNAKFEHIFYGTT